jgi:hypothetical protein
MNWIEFNTSLRNTIINIINLYDGDSGIRTTIFKSLIGNQGLSTMAKWIDTTDSDKIYNLGIKPLTKVADSTGYNLRIVFVPKKEKNTIEIDQYIDSLNISFLDYAKQLIHNMINQVNYNNIKHSKNDNVSKLVKNVMKDIDYDNI